MTVSPVTGRSGPWGFTRDSSERGSERRNGPHLRAAGQHRRVPADPHLWPPRRGLLPLWSRVHLCLRIPAGEEGHRRGVFFFLFDGGGPPPPVTLILQRVNPGGPAGGEGRGPPRRDHT